MVVACPRCARTLTDTAGEAAFCMFCGQRLRGTDSPAGSGDAGTDAGATQAFTPAEPAAPAEPQLTRVGRYRLVRFIGAGGMGQVYEAEGEDTGERVAVKLLSGRLAGNPQSVERFRQEGRVASQISHPNCVFVLRADADAGRPYIVMELMPGRTLKDVVDDRGPLPVAEAVAHTLDVVDGLAEAHRLGVIHRDVKPSNCFVTADQRVKVGDFGLSKSLVGEADGKATSTGAFLGTVLYASPEQIRGEPVGYESDVYAVCGTLYHLLTGRAPYQHDSVTAALAKAVSEPAPSVRARRPDVPRELDKLIRRGLDRDRANRFASLDALGDALRALQPERAVPARRRVMAFAYTLDYVILLLLLLPLELVRYAVAGRPGDEFGFNLLDLGWPTLVLTAVYYTLFEGLGGTTPGKNLLRLRVEVPGRAGPPGLRAALVRTLVFNGLWWVMAAGPEWLVADLPAAAGVPLGVLVFVGCGAALVRQVRRSAGGWRGVHDFAAGTRTVQRPVAPDRVHLRSQFPDPLDRPARADGLPAAVGGFGVVGKLLALPDGREVWAAEDKGLNRRLLVRVCPAGAAPPDDDARPGRLRAVGHGTLPDGRGWVAFAAPAGAPLLDLATPRRPLGWAAARPVLEQVAAVAAADPGVRLEQVWVEPTGRVQVADFPLPTGSGRTGGTDPDPLRLPREAATALLEGEPRAAGGPVRAPLPPHGSAALAELVRPGGSADGLRAGLAEVRSLPPQVTAGMRAAQLGVQGLFLAVGLVAMFVGGGVLSFGVAAKGAGQAATARRAVADVQDPARRTVLLAATTDRRPGVPPDVVGGAADRVRAALAPDRLADTAARLAALAAYRDAQADRERRRLTRPERAVLARLERLFDAKEGTATSPFAVASLLGEADRAARPDADRRDRWMLFVGLAAVVGGPAAGWVVFAGLFRGGLGLRLGGLVPVRADGRPAGRLRCGLRAVLVWGPVAGLLLASLWVQYAHPGLVALRAGLWLAALLLLPAYLLVALRDPPRPPHDRLLGTWLVPA